MPIIQPSRFNLYLGGIQEDRFVLYNTLSTNVRILNKAAKVVLQTADLAVLPQEIIDDLVAGRFLVSSNTDELELYREERDRHRYDTHELSVVALTNYKCNLACTYCYVPSLNLPMRAELDNPMSDATARQLVRFTAMRATHQHANSISVDFVGLGEPLLHPSPLRIIMKGLREFSSSSHILVSFNIVTNGVLLIHNLDLLSNDVGVQVTLDGPQEYHNRVRKYANGNGTFDIIMSSINMIKQTAARCSVRIHVDRDNGDSVPRLLTELKSRFGSDPLLKIVPRLPGSDISCDWSQSCLTQGELTKMLALWEMALDMGFRLQFGPLLNVLNCAAMSDSTFVCDPRGLLYKCEGLAGNPTYCIGNIREGVKREGAYEEWMQIDQLKSSECQQCTLLPTCGGWCPHLERYYRGSFLQACCTKNKELLLGALKLQLKKMLPELPL